MRPPPLDRPTAWALTDADVLRRLDALLADADPEAAAVLDRLGDAAELLNRLADPDPAEAAALARLADLDADPEAAAVLDRLARAYRPAQAAPENRPPGCFRDHGRGAKTALPPRGKTRP